MKCPIDNTVLIISERQNIEIDYCPECRGVWLDRGELDKLIAKNEGQTTSYISREHNMINHQQTDHNRRSGEHHTDKYTKPIKKRESFLADIFDFGD